uniref:Uncharacterized protein n=1 Tax=Arundo donax TaxID=35708 RepID=A0A0A9GHM1_ARUDO
MIARGLLRSNAVSQVMMPPPS